MAKQIGIWIGVFAVTFALLILLIRQTGVAQDPNKVYPEVSVIAAEDHVRGARAGKPVLVEYGDFQCPACGDYEPLVEEVTKNYGASISFVYRHFPLPQHKNAIPAARYAEAANLQGKFWEYHDKLFATQKEWSDLVDPTDKFVQYGKDLGIDVVPFKADATGEITKKRVESDRDAGDRIGLHSTPSFFLNGRRITPATYDEFKKAIDSALGR